MVNILGTTNANNVQVGTNVLADQGFFANSKVSITATGSGTTYLAFGNGSALNAQFGALDGGNASTLIGFDNRTGTVTITGTTNGNFAGTIFNGNAAGALAFIKNGLSTQTLSGVNTYTGGTTVSGGRLKIVNPGIFGSSTINIGTGDVFEINATSTGGISTGNTGQHLAATSITGAGTMQLTGTSAYSPSWSQGTTFNMSAGGLIDLQGGQMFLGFGSSNNWTNNLGDLNVASEGCTFDTWDTANVIVNNLTGTGTVTRGTGFASGLGTLTLGSNNGTATFSGVLTQGSGTLALSKIGTGTQILSGANTYTGTTTINQGTLQLANSASLASNVVFGTSNNPTLQLNTVNSTDNISFSKNISGGSANNATVEKLGAGSAALSGTLTFSGGLKVTAGTLNVNTAATYTGTTTIGNGTLRLSQIGNSNFNGNTPTVDLNAQSLTAGPITSWINNGSAGNFTGNGTVQSGGAAFNGNNVVHFNGSQFLSNAAVNSTNETVFYVGSLDNTANARLVGGTSGNWLMGYWGGHQDAAYFNGWLSPGAGGGDPTATATTHLYDATISSAGAASFYSGTNGAPGTLIASGSGFQSSPGLELGGYNGANEMSKGSIGEVLVFNTVLSNSDRLAVEAYLNYIWFGVGSPEAFQSNLLPTATAVNITGTGTLDINGVNQTIGSLASANVLSNVTLGNATLTTGTDNTSTTFAGIISGTGGSLTKTGTGTMALTGFNTYTGTTAINGGELNVGTAQNGNVSGPLGSYGTITFAGGSLQYSNLNQFDYSYRFSTAPGQAISIDTNNQNVHLRHCALTSSAAPWPNWA